MRILLIAYDYPPLASPQAIRWYYLSRELARQGGDVHVLAPNLPAYDSACLEVPSGITMHRCDAGGLAGWLARRRPMRQSASPCVSGEGASGSAPARPIGLNWKGRLYKRVSRFIDLCSFPDSRGQWRKPARIALEQLLGTLRPDVVISSHEPAVTLQLGLQVAGRVPAWLADLGDPVLAPYTARRWRRRAAQLEAQVCRVAAAISVTTTGTRELLRVRHAADTSKIFVLSQGYDDSTPRVPTVQLVPGASLRLLYTGRFYPFRDPTPLLQAVLALEHVRLTVVAPEVKPELLAYAARSGGRIVFLGEQPHDRVLELQRNCDVLVNIGNALEAQVPGKLFEYLGSGKPILHCQSMDDDPAVTLLAQWRCGWSCRNDRASLQELLAGLLTSRQRLAEVAAGDAAAIARHGWSRLGEELLAHCRRITGEAGGDDGAHR